jgi:hypothetical protein
VSIGLPLSIVWVWPCCVALPDHDENWAAHQSEFFCEIEKKTPTESFQLLKEVYGDNVMSRTRVFGWHERFVEGREEVEDGERPGRPSTSKTEENAEKISEIFDLRVKRLIKSTPWRSWPSSEKEWGRKGRNCGRRNHGFCIKTMHQLTTPSRWSSF